MMRTVGGVVRKGIDGNKGITHFECLRVALKGGLRSLYTVRTLDSSSTLTWISTDDSFCQAAWVLSSGTYKNAL
jgi:hypothetical protein